MSRGFCYSRRMTLSRRTFLAGLALTVAGAMPVTVRAARPSITVYKDPG